MGYWSDLEDRKTPCVCGHKKSLHHYLELIGDNSGRCVARYCDCTIYEESS